MSTERVVVPVVPPPTPPSRAVRIEYLDFKNLAQHREFRLRVCGPDESTEFRLLIAIDAFADGRVRLQEGPDVCYQVLMRAVAAGLTASPGLITVEDADLASYRAAHTPAPKQKRSPSATQAPESTQATQVSATSVPRREPRAPSPWRRPVAPLVKDEPEPAFREGQRVSHALFGLGVTSLSDAGHTVIRFDQDGPKRFVTSMLVVDVLSAPHTWETGPRGKNRPCGTPSPAREADGAQ